MNILTYEQATPVRKNGTTAVRNEIKALVQFHRALLQYKSNREPCLEKIRLTPAYTLRDQGADPTTFEVKRRVSFFGFPPDFTLTIERRVSKRRYLFSCLYNTL